MGTDPWDPFVCNGDRSSVLRGLTMAVRSRFLEHELTGWEPIRGRAGSAASLAGKACIRRTVVLSRRGRRHACARAHSSDARLTPSPHACTRAATLDAEKGS
jgi:hypothetical protein